MDPSLQRLADACGVATSYEDWAHRPVPIAEESVRLVLEGLGVDVRDPSAALAAWQARRWREVLPPTVVVRQRLGGGDSQVVPLRSPDGVAVHAEIRYEDGRFEQDLDEPLLMEPGPPVRFDPATGHVERLLEIASGLPLGDHRLLAYVDGALAADVPFIVTPDRLPLPAKRLWGWMAQLYAVRSAWGMGDWADLAELATWSGAQGAGLLLVNPMHAAATIAPIQNSPYYPASRRFHSPLYLRPQQLAEYAAAPADVRRRVEELGASIPEADLIDRDAVWAAKSVALEALFGYAVRRPDAEDSPGLTDFATWCALTEVHGADWRQWPKELHDPAGPAVVAARKELAARIDYHRWLQHCCVEQLVSAQRAATLAGMTVGIVHDLAVGVDPGGADAWALQDVFAGGFTVGAPPDSFNQRGQDWGLPPWRPDRLAETGYAPIREMMRAVLRTGGGLRIDHILGLFRLWWVPPGCSASQGSYVLYDADALLGIAALEAHRASALVVGEDLGTVPSQVRAKLQERGVLGSTVLWFERDDDGALVAPQRWRELAVASVTTHDLPTAAGFLAGEHVRVRAALGLLTDPAAEKQAAERQRAELLALLAAEGLISSDGPDAADVSVEDIVLGLHGLLGASPSRVVLAALGDAVGDLRQPNLPGTVDEYPNWRLPLADAAGRPIPREAPCAAAGPARLAAQLRARIAGG